VADSPASDHFAGYVGDLVALRPSPLDGHCIANKTITFDDDHNRRAARSRRIYDGKALRIANAPWLTREMTVDARSPPQRVPSGRDDNSIPWHRTIPDVAGRAAGAGGNFAFGAGKVDGFGASAPRSDRRLARGVHTRLTIVEGMIALIQSGNIHPTVRQIADHAGVSRRLVYYHFSDIDALFLAAASLHATRYRSLITPLPSRGPLDLRIRAICHQRRQLFEAMAPVHRMAFARTHGLVGLKRFLADHRSLLRKQLAATLTPEIHAHGKEGAELLDAMDLATGWEYWFTLRDRGNHSPSSAERAVIFAVTTLLR
jgi:AcrR family transcriptional regulator